MYCVFCWVIITDVISDSFFTSSNLYLRSCVPVSLRLHLRSCAYVCTCLIISFTEIISTCVKLDQNSEYCVDFKECELCRKDEMAAPQ